MRDIGFFSVSAQANAPLHGGQPWHSRVRALDCPEGQWYLHRVPSNFLTRRLDAQPPQETTMTPLSVVRRAGSFLPLSLALAVCLLPSPARAQAVKGTLLGTVTDSTGAGVPGATVAVTEVQTGISRSTTTNASGNYTFSNLKDGVYRVEAELSGFRKTVRENVKVDVNTTVRVDLALQVGNLAEAVTVVQEAPPLQTDRADTGRIIESKQVTEMPLSFNRNFRSEEHTSELQSHSDLVCRLLLEKKNTT